LNQGNLKRLLARLSKQFHYVRFRYSSPYPDRLLSRSLPNLRTSVYSIVVYNNSLPSLQFLFRAIHLLRFITRVFNFLPDKTAPQHSRQIVAPLALCITKRAPRTVHLYLTILADAVIQSSILSRQAVHCVDVGRVPTSPTECCSEGTLQEGNELRRLVQY